MIGAACATMNRIRKRQSPLRRYAPYARAAAGAFRTIRQATATRRQQGRRSYDAPMTSQKDSRLMYRKKRMPARRRKAWKRFKRKVTAVQISNTNIQVAVEQQVCILPAIVNQSSAQFHGMYGIAGNPGSTGFTGAGPPGQGQLNDIAKIFAAKYAGAKYRRLLFASACLDVHVKGTGSSSFILEVYEIEARKDYTALSSAYDTVEEIYYNGFADYGPLGTAPGATGSSLGTTPFHCKAFCQAFKITKKYRVQGSAGETISFQMRDPRNHMIDGNMIANPQIMWKKGLLKGYFFQLYGAPSGTTGAVLTENAEVKITAIKSYTFRQLDSESVQGGQTN